MSFINGIELATERVGGEGDPSNGVVVASVDGEALDLRFEDGVDDGTNLMIDLGDLKRVLRFYGLAVTKLPAR